MEAKDTVINCQKDCSDSGTTWCSDCGYGPAFDDGCEAQAEITWDAAFKAGQEDVILETKMGTLTVSSLVKRGRKDVVEWMEEHSQEDKTNTGFYSNPKYGRYISFESWQLWQAKLKEWGL